MLYDELLFVLVAEKRTKHIFPWVAKPKGSAINKTTSMNTVRTESFRHGAYIYGKFSRNLDFELGMFSPPASHPGLGSRLIFESSILNPPREPFERRHARVELLGVSGICDGRSNHRAFVRQCAEDDRVSWAHKVYQRVAVERCLVSRGIDDTVKVRPQNSTAEDYHRIAEIADRMPRDRLDILPSLCTGNKYLKTSQTIVQEGQ